MGARGKRLPEWGPWLVGAGGRGPDGRPVAAGRPWWESSDYRSDYRFENSSAAWFSACPIAVLPVCPESSMTTSFASGQAWATSHAV